MTETDKTLVNLISFPSFQATEMEQQSCQASLPFLDLFLKNMGEKKSFPKRETAMSSPLLLVSAVLTIHQLSQIYNSVEFMHYLCCRNTKIKCSFKTLQNIYIEIALSS